MTGSMRSKRHFVVPDTQVKPGVPVDHMRWIGQAVREYEPDVLVHLGDHWDFPSLSRWSAEGSLEREGQRVAADIAAGNEALAMLEDAMRPFKPRRKVLLRGNHEDRLTRYVRDRPLLEGAIGFHLLADRELGWEVVDYFHGSPQAIEIDGIQYAHYFANPNTGKPIGGTITNRLAKIGSSFVQGHVHKGQFCEMPLTLDYLCRKYEGMGVARYLQRNRRDAKERYTLARGAA
jgi:hypothetical protein